MIALKMSLFTPVTTTMGPNKGSEQKKEYTKSYKDVLQGKKGMFGVFICICAVFLSMLNVK